MKKDLVISSLVYDYYKDDVEMVDRYLSYLKDKDDIAEDARIWAENRLEEEWDMFNFHTQGQDLKNTETVINGSIGRWDGTYTIRETTCSNFMKAFQKCVNSADDYSMFFDDNGVLSIECYHHDGTNSFSLTKSDGSNFTKEDFLF